MSEGPEEQSGGGVGEGGVCGRVRESSFFFFLTDVAYAEVYGPFLSVLSFTARQTDRHTNA